MTSLHPAVLETRPGAILLFEFGLVLILRPISSEVRSFIDPLCAYSTQSDSAGIATVKEEPVETLKPRRKTFRKIPRKPFRKLIIIVIIQLLSGRLVKIFTV